MRVRTASLSLLPLLLTSAAAAQTRHQGPYATSFEASKFRLGKLAGATLNDGQDGWLVTQNQGGQSPNLAAIEVQNRVVRSGSQAAMWDAARAGSFGYAHLRTNKLFTPNGVSVIELDFRIDRGQRPSASWDIQVQHAPNPASVHAWWSVRSDNEVWFTKGKIGTNLSWIKTGVRLAPATWHHARLVIDVPRNTTSLDIDGRNVVRGIPPIAQFSFAGHAFTSIVLDTPGDDKFYFDNFAVRDLPRGVMLTSDLPSLRVGQRAKLELRLAGGPSGASRNYLVLGSLSGTTPGIPLPGGRSLPLKWDGIADLIANNTNSPLFQGFLGKLNTDGNAVATFDSVAALPAALGGRTMNFAFVAFWPTDLISPATPVVLTR